MRGRGRGRNFNFKKSITGNHFFIFEVCFFLLCFASLFFFFFFFFFVIVRELSLFCSIHRVGRLIRNSSHS